MPFFTQIVILIKELRIIIKMNKIILVCLFAVLAFAGARKAPRTHSDFFWSAPND